MIAIEKAREKDCHKAPDDFKLLFAFGQLESQTRELIRFADAVLNEPSREKPKDELAEAICRTELAISRIRRQAGIDELKGEL